MNKKALVFAILALALIINACGPAGTMTSSKSIIPHQREIWIDGAIIVSKTADGLTRVTVSVDADEIWVTPDYTISNVTCVTKTASCLFETEFEFLQIDIWKDGLYGGLLIDKDSFNKGNSFYMIPKFNKFLTEQPVSAAFWRSPDHWQARLIEVGSDEGGEFLIIVAGYPGLTQDIKVYPAQKEVEQDGYLITWFEETGGIEGSHWWIQIWK